MVDHDRTHSSRPGAGQTGPSADRTQPLHTDELYHAPFNPWIITIVATLATFMEVLDTSIANVALPHIAGNMGVAVTDATWVLTSYLIANAMVLPATAWISSLIGRRNYYICSVAIFTFSSFLCGIAPSLSMLVFFRFLQGLGGGGLQPTTQAILIDTFPARLRGMGMAVYGMTVVVAPVIGPTLGGYITDHYTWRWVFFINIPVGIAAILLSLRLITDPPYLRRRTGPNRFRIDYIGLGLIALGLGCMQLVLDLGERLDWFGSIYIVIFAATSATALLGGILWELNHKEPIIRLRLLKERNLGLCWLHMLIFGAVLFSTTALLPLLMQTLLGFTAELSGLALTPGALVIAVLMPVVGWAVGRFDARWIIVSGIVIVAYSLNMMANFTPQVGFRAVVIARIVQGLGLGCIFVPVTTMAYSYVNAHERNYASSLMSIARNVGGSVGIGYTSAMLTETAQIHHANLVHNLTPYSPAFNLTVAALTDRFSTWSGDAVHAAAMAHDVVAVILGAQARMLGYLQQFRLLSMVFLLAIPVVLMMKRMRTSHRHVEMVVE